MPDRRSNTMPNKILKHISDKISEIKYQIKYYKIYEIIPKNILNKISENIPNKISNKLPENIPDKMSENTKQNVGKYPK